MIRIMNQSLQMIAELEPIYFEWTRRLFRPDDFTIKVPVNIYTETLNHVVWGNRVATITHKELNKDFITIKGKEYGFPVFNRISFDLERTDQAESLQKYIVETNCITPVTRRIANFSVESDQGRGASITYTGRYKTLEKVMEEIYYRSELGYEVLFDASNGFIFTTIEGKDRTTSQSVLPPVIFAEKYGNLYDVVVTDSSVNYFTVAYVGGAENAGVRNVKEVGTATGNDRYELFVDAQDIPFADGDPPLIAKGNEILEEYGQEVTIDADFTSTPSFTYGTDFMIGDLCTVIHEDYQLDLRLLEVKTVIDTKETNTFAWGAEPITLKGVIDKKLSLINSGVRK
jgi:hypothetical protein